MISVIIPTLNRKDLLARCLRSLGAQTLVPGEIIIVDNSSAVGTGSAETAVFSSQNSPPKMIFLKEPRKGVWHAKNTGIGAAKGDILAFIDDDAEAAPDWLERIKACFVKTGASGVGGPAVALWESQPPAYLFRSSKALSYIGVFSLGDKAKRLGDFRDFLIGTNCAFKRHVFAEGHRFTALSWGNGTGGDDLEFSRRIAALYPVVYDPAVIVRHFMPRRKLNLLFLARAGFDYGMKKVLVGRPLSPRGVRDLWGVDGWISLFSFTGYCFGYLRRLFEDKNAANI